MLLLKKLSLENFGPYQGCQSLILGNEPTKPETPAKITLIGGMNGGGKTSFLDALKLIFYGRRATCSTRGRQAYHTFLNDCVHRGAELASLELELVTDLIAQDEKTLSDFQVVRVRRTWPADLKSGQTDRLEVFLNGTLNRYLIETWDEVVEKVIPLGLSALFLFDGEQIKELAEQDTPPPALMKAFRNILNIELADRLSVDLDVLIARLLKQLDQHHIPFLEAISERMDAAKTAHTEFETKLKEAEEALQLCQEEEQRSLDRYIAEGGRLAGESQYRVLELAQLVEKAEAATCELREAANGPLCFKLIEPLLCRALGLAKAEVYQEEAEIALRLIEERDQRLMDHLSNRVDSHHFVSHHFLGAVQAFIDAENTELRAKAEGDRLLEANRLAVEKLETLIQVELPLCTSSADRNLMELDSTERLIEHTERLIAGAASPEVHLELSQELEQAREQTRLAKERRDAAVWALNLAKQACEKTSQELQEYAESHITELDTKHKIEAARKAKETTNKFIQIQLDRKLSNLEDEINFAFGCLLHKQNLAFRVRVDRQTFALTLHNQEDEAVSKSRLSAGEKQMLATAFLWGLSRMSTRPLPVVVDTPLGRLDSSHRESLVKRYFPAAAAHQVILLSTDTEFGEKEVSQLRSDGAIAYEYRLDYNPETRGTTVVEGYFDFQNLQEAA